ncbi:hypothetical protein ES5_10172, partial [Dietzia cinnamea P4]
ARVASDQADDVRKAAQARKKAAEKQARKKSARLGKDAKKKTARFEKDAGKAALIAKKKSDEVRAKAADAIHP